MYEKLEEALQRISLLENALKSFDWQSYMDGSVTMFDVFGHDAVAARQLILEYIEEGYKIPNNEDILRETY